MLRGDATSVRPKAQSPNGCDERRDERPWRDAVTEEGRPTPRHKSGRTERWREMETGLTECEALRWKRERRGVVKKIGWVNLGEPGIFHQYSFTCLHGSLPTFSAGD